MFGTPRSRLDRTALVAFLCAVLLGSSACISRTVTKQVYDRDAVTVSLRHRIEGGTVVERDYQHPTSITKQRLSYILGAIDVETREDDEAKILKIAIRPEILEPVAAGLAESLELANSDQELVVMAVRKQRRLGLFHKKYLTSFVAYVRDERLYIHLSRIEWEIPKEKENKDLPEPRRDTRQMDFRAVPTRKMTQAGSQGVGVRWRDSLFSGPVRTHIGNVEQRRTILYESEIPREELEADDGPSLEDLDPDTLRALADLEEARRQGRLTETEYLQRRETLLGGDRF